MAKERKKMIHVHSSVSNKQPLASLLEVGELAVNNAAGNEFISTKNTDDEVIRFSSDNKVLSIIENKTVMPYKGEVLEPTEQDLLENKSQIVIGLNQVATPNTAGYDQVNGATDMHGDEINPSSDGGKTNGAGFAINMDKYAMIGANPSFSSVTTTDILSEDELFIGNNKELEEDVPMPDISVYGSGVKLHANDGKVGITATDDINISGTHDGNFNVDNNMCLGAGNEMKIGAAEKLTIGEDCSGTETEVVEIKGGEIIINREATNNLSATTVEGALEELADKIAAAGDGYITGGHVDSATGIIDVDVVEHSGVTITGLEDYINNRLGDISGIAKRSEVTEETIDDEPKLVISFFDKDDNELEDLQIVLDDYYNKGEINDMELVIAAALNDLNDRVITISGDVQVLNVEVEELKNRRDNYVTDGEVNGDTGIIYLNMNASDEPAEVTGLAEYVGGMVGRLSGDTYVVSGSVDTANGTINLVKNDGTQVTPISGLSQYVEDKTDGLFKSVDYVTSSETIVFKDKDGDEVGTIDASRFVKDGMVMSVEVGTPSGGTHAGVECLIITWNNDAAPEVDPLVTEIPLTDIFDPAILDDYYTRDEVNQMLGENFALDLFSGESFSSVTDVILKDERVVAAALNDLNSRVEELDDIKLDKDDYIDSYVESGHVDSGSGIINLEVKNQGNVEVAGLDVYLNGKISAVSGDTNNYVDSGTVRFNDGIIELRRYGLSPNVEVSGLSEYVAANSSKYTFSAPLSANASNNVSLVYDDRYFKVTTGTFGLNVANGEDVYSPNELFEAGSGSVASSQAVYNAFNSYITQVPSGGTYFNKSSVNSFPIVTDDEPAASASTFVAPSWNAMSEAISAIDTDAYEVYDMTDIAMSVPHDSIDGNISSAETASETLFDEINAIWQSGKIPVADIVLPGETGNILIPLTKSSKSGYNAFYGSESQHIFTYPGVEKGNATTEHLVIKKESGKTVIMALCDYSDSDRYVHVTGDSMTGPLLMRQSPSNSGIVASIGNETEGNHGLVFSNGGMAGNNIQAGSITVYNASSFTYNDAVSLNYAGVSKYGPEIARIDTSGISSLYGFTHNGISASEVKNNYVLLAGGGYKSISDLATEVASGDGNTYVVSGSFNSDQELVLRRTDGQDVIISGMIESINAEHPFVLRSGDTMTGTLEITGITAAKQYGLIVTQGSDLEGGVVVNGDDLTVEHANLNISHGAAYSDEGYHVNGKSNDYVILASGGTMPLSSITPTDVWVNESGDTMTGTLTIASKSSSKQNALEVNGNVSVSGDVTATGAMYSSDKRLKENIKFIPGDDLENAKKIDFKEFNFISDKDSQKVGVIAQELKENGLGKFTKQNDAGYLTVDYISLLCLKIAQLEKEIKELKEGK